jgi:hypothetical protein
LKKDVFDWHVLPLASPQNLFSILQQLIHLGGNGIKKGMCMIWKVVVWSLWRHRNLVMFGNGIIDSEKKVLEEVKVLTWRWCLNRAQIAHSLPYEWRVQPKLCMAR